MPKSGENGTKEFYGLPQWLTMRFSILVLPQSDKKSLANEQTHSITPYRLTAVRRFLAASHLEMMGWRPLHQKISAFGIGKGK